MQKIKKGFERSKKALTLKPSLGLSTATSITKSIDGLTCETTEGPWKLITDMPENVGGKIKGPTPGVLGRAALGSCIAMGYMLYAAHKDIVITQINVEIQTDFDDGGLFGTSDSVAGYSEVRYKVNIESEASEELINELVEDAESHSPYLDVFRRALNCKRILNYSKAKV
jgi:uncharacterized OsmC-like protein